MNINNFLQECIDKDWDLDIDDIKHILNLDFDYVRNSNTRAETYDGDGAD